jgi:hypothetical protein
MRGSWRILRKSFWERDSSKKLSPSEEGREPPVVRGDWDGSMGVGGAEAAAAAGAAGFDMFAVSSRVFGLDVC